MACQTPPTGAPRPRLQIGAVLLAAGAASRLGHQPKVLLELDGQPLIRRQLQALAEAGANEIVVVLGHHAERLAPALLGLPATIVHNPEPDAGQVSSQRLGLAALSQPLDAVIVALADQPLLETADIKALLCAWKTRAPGVEVVHPLVAGERGNPVLLGASVRTAILARGADFGCRQWQAEHSDAVAPFISDNTHYRVDIDTPADIEAFERSTGRTLRWPQAAAAAAASAPAPLNIHHNPAAARFEVLVQRRLAVCHYRRSGDVLQLTHTEVPPQAQGGGVAAALVQATLDWARSEGLRVRPDCSYVASYMRRHPETQDLLAR